MKFLEHQKQRSFHLGLNVFNQIDFGVRRTHFRKQYIVSKITHIIYFSVH